MATFLLGMPTSGKSSWARSFSSRALQMDFGLSYDQKAISKVRRFVAQMISSSMFDMVDIVDSHVCYFDQDIIQMLLEQGHDVFLSVGDFTDYQHPSVEEISNCLLSRIKARDGEGRFYDEAKQHSAEWIRNNVALFWKLVKDCSSWHPSSTLHLVRNYCIPGAVRMDATSAIVFNGDHYVDSFDQAYPLIFDSVAFTSMLAGCNKIVNSASVWGIMRDIKEELYHV